MFRTGVQFSSWALNKPLKIQTENNNAVSAQADATMQNHMDRYLIVRYLIIHFTVHTTHGCADQCVVYDTIRYDTIRDAILTCARKPT